MKILIKILLLVITLLFVLLVVFNVWGYATLGTIVPAENALRNPNVNHTVMVLGGTGSAGDGLLKSAMEAPEVKKIYALTRRMSPRLEAGQASGRVEVLMHKDFTDYSGLSDILAEIDSVLWGLGTSSLQVDEQTYRLIHVDFPLSFIKAWLAAKGSQASAKPMSFHFITGMGTGPDESAQWAKDKAYTESKMAEMANGTGLRTFSYRSAWIRPTSEQANALVYFGELLLKPGHLVIPSVDLGNAMLEIGARVDELPNGTLIDQLDSIRYAEAYREAQ